MNPVTSKTFFRDDGRLDDEEAICVTRNKAAAMLAISTATLDRLVKAGEIPCLKLPGRVLFRPDALRTWAKRRETRVNHETGSATEFTEAPVRRDAAGLEEPARSTTSTQEHQ